MANPPKNKPKKKRRPDTFDTFQVVATNDFMLQLSTFHVDIPIQLMEVMGPLLNSFCFETRRVKIEDINFAALTHHVYSTISSVSSPYIGSNPTTVKRFVETMLQQGNVHIYNKGSKVTVVMDVNINPKIPHDTFALCSLLTEFNRSTIH